MYTFICSESVKTRLREFGKVSTSISTKVEELVVNPKARAKQTEIPIIGKYYVNAGRFSILFDIDEEREKIHVLNIVYSSFLHKVLSGKV